MGPNLPHQKLHVALDGVDADTKVFGDLLVAAVTENQSDDLLLPMIEIPLPEDLREVEALWFEPLNDEEVALLFSLRNGCLFRKEYPPYGIFPAPTLKDVYMAFPLSSFIGKCLNLTLPSVKDLLPFYAKGRNFRN